MFSVNNRSYVLNCCMYVLVLVLHINYILNALTIHYPGNEKNMHSYACICAQGCMYAILCMHPCTHTYCLYVALIVRHASTHIIQLFLPHSCWLATPHLVFWSFAGPVLIAFMVSIFLFHAKFVMVTMSHFSYDFNEFILNDKIVLFLNKYYISLKKFRFRNKKGSVTLVV